MRRAYKDMHYVIPRWLYGFVFFYMFFCSNSRLQCSVQYLWKLISPPDSSQSVTLFSFYLKWWQKALYRPSCVRGTVKFCNTSTHTHTEICFVNPVHSQWPVLFSDTSWARTTEVEKKMKILILHETYEQWLAGGNGGTVRGRLREGSSMAYGIVLPGGPLREMRPGREKRESGPRKTRTNRLAGQEGPS